MFHLRGHVKSYRAQVMDGEDGRLIRKVSRRTIHTDLMFMSYTPLIQLQFYTNEARRERGFSGYFYAVNGKLRHLIEIEKKPSTLYSLSCTI